MPTLREHELAFEQDPTQMEPFLQLRKAYREGGRFDKLVTLYELRAQALTDGAKAAELFYLAAEVRIDQLGDTEGAEADLAHAVDRDPANLKAVRRLKLIYREQNRLGDVMTMLELEAASIARTMEPARIAELEVDLGQLWGQYLSRLERALNVPAPHRQAEVTPEGLRAVESARKIYRALGDFNNVVRLYEIELGLATDPKRRADLLLGLGRVLGEKIGDLEGAAQRLGEVVRLRPRDDKALDALAAIYTNPSWPGGDGRERAAQIYYQIARRRQEAGDVENAVAALRRAMTANPGSPEASELLERVLYDAGRLSDLDMYYRERVAEARADEEKMDFLFKRAQLAEEELNRPDEALPVYEEIVAIEPPGGPASQKLGALYARRQDYGKLAALHERQLERIVDPAARLTLLQELATLYRDRLGDPEQAAVYWHAILQIDPGHPEGQEAYANHFRQRGDWQSLVDLLDFSFEHARTSGGPVEDLTARLEELAIISERHLGDVDRALSAWQRLEELVPGHDRAREAQKRMLLKGKQWDRMAAVLEREAEAATDAAQKAEAQRKLARIYVERLGAADRAISLYQELLAQDPRDAVAARALLELHEKEGRWADVATLLRGQLDALATRQEKLQALRRLLVLYDEQLGDLVEGSWAATEILKLVPGDREALERLEAILERSDDKARLVQTLEYHSRYAASTEEKLRLGLRIADILQNQVGDVAQAAIWWEEVLRLAPGDATALDALAAAYERLGQPEELLRVLDLQIERLADDAATQAELLRKMARLANDTLKQPARALRAWERLLRVLPADTEALASAADIYRGKGDFRALCGILERQIPLASEPAGAVAIALERARLLEEQLGAPGEAAQALAQITDELDPRNQEAYERLRRLAEGAADWSLVVTVAEKQLLLAEGPEEKLRLALEIGALLRDRLGDTRRAMAAFERAVELDPNSQQALYALAALYANGKEPQRLVFANEKLLGLIEEPGERRRLMFDIAETYAGPLGEGPRAFEWYRRAWNEAPDADALGRLEAIAEADGLWEELIQVHEGARTRAAATDEQLALSRTIAGLCEVQLGDASRAFAVLRDALSFEPDGATLLPELERLAERAGAAGGAYAGLLDVYARVGRARPAPEERLELLRRRAEVREHKLGDASGALDETLRRFSLAPEEPRVHDEILRLAEATHRWEDALSVEAQLFARAGDISTKVEIACRAAELVETKVRDHLRAFRAYLNAFRLAPNDERIVAHLWRLAAAIEGRAHESAAAKTPTPLPVRRNPDATMELDAAALLLASRSHPDRTIELDAAALRVASRRNPDATMALDAAALLAEAQRNPDTTIELDASKLVVGAEPTGSIDSVGSDEILTVEELDETDESGTAPPRPPSVPIVVAQPWEEFAQAYELLPATDHVARRAHLMKVAEIWERGARDFAKALRALERAFALDPSAEEARTELQRIAAQESRWDEVCEIYLRAAHDAAPDVAVALHHEVARFREALAQLPLAEERYRAVLHVRPDDQRALGRLEEILRNGERWPDLASLLEKRTTGAVESLPAGAERRAKAAELADLYENRLERPYEAIDTLERYVLWTDDDDRGPDHLDVLAENRQSYEALGRLYARVGMWPKAAAALQKEIDLTSDPTALRERRLRLGGIYEHELAQPEQAIATYQALLEIVPEDAEVLAALDRLYEAHGRYEELQGVLETRAAFAEGEERAQLIRRRATLLEEELGNPAAAADALRLLGAEALRDDETTKALLRNLRRAGLVHEAMKLLGQRIDLLVSEGAAASRLAALYLELGAVRLEQQGDAAGAQEAIEKALAQVPDDRDALDALAALHLRSNDFAAYARTRERGAEALGRSGAVEAGAPLWLEAGRVYRDQLVDPAAARRCFERAVTASPRDVEALRALAALLSAEGFGDEARGLFERQLEVVEEPAAKAAVMTDLARVIWEKPGDAEEALRLLDEALDLSSDHLPAVVLMADIYYKEQQWAEAERRLLQVVRRMRGAPHEMARLYHRLAEVYDKLGRLEEGHRQLVEADKAVPGQLLIRLSLGENRFQAKRWREATMHLEGIADHPDAPSYPDEVANGLAHAAQAEMMLKRPDRAIALYEAALRLSPEHRASLRALADIALERGGRDEAVAHLRRLVPSATDRHERAQLLEQIGDLEEALNHGAESRASYEAAVAALDGADVAEEEKLALLEKTLRQQRAMGAMVEAAETAQRLIDLVKDGRERASRRHEAALILLEQGHATRAAEILEKALADSADDEDVLATLCVAYERLGRESELRGLLARSLPAMGAIVDESGTRRRAELWERLGRLEAADTDADEPGDAGAALAAFERAVGYDPDRTSARIALAQLYAGRPEHDAAALRNHRALVMADLTRAVSLRALAKAYASAGRIDGARCCYEVLDLFGETTDEDRAFLEEHPTLARKPEDPYATTIEDEDRARHLSHPESRVMAEVFTAIWEGVPALAGETLEALGLSPQEKISPLSDLTIGKIYGQVAKALGNKRTSLYLAPGAPAREVVLTIAPPPAVVISQRLAEAASPDELRFLLGRALELTRAELILASAMPPKEFATLFGSVLKAFHPRHSRYRAGGQDVASEHAARLKKAVPYKVAKRLAELFQEHEATPFSSPRWRTVVAETGNRAGLLMCGDLRVAARMVVAESGRGAAGEGAPPVTPQRLREEAQTAGPLRELLRYALSDEYFLLRESLGTGAARAAAA